MHSYRGWLWRSSGRITREDKGFYHYHFLFLKYDDDGKLILRKYYWRTKEPYRRTEKEMAEQIIDNAIACGFWREAEWIKSKRK